MTNSPALETAVQTPALRVETRDVSASPSATVLFVCVHNAGRSQMAAGFLRHFAGDRVRVLSAGTAPKDAVNPVAVQVMAELGIDITDAVPTVLTDDSVLQSDYVITMGCGDACPFYPGKHYLDWKLADPAGQAADAVRAIRDEIRSLVEALVVDIDSGSR